MKRLKGFTLVELVIVIAIVIILSVVSVPIYRGYTKQAKWSEGYALLGMIMSAQKTYYARYGNFLDDGASSSGHGFTCNEEVLGIDARSNKYFTSFQVCNNSVTNKYEFRASVVKPADLRNIEGKSLLTLVYSITRTSYFSETYG